MNQGRGNISPKTHNTNTPEQKNRGYRRLLQINIYNTSVTVLKVNHFLCSNHPNILINLIKSVKVLVGQSCLTLCNPMDSSPPGSSVHGILQAAILEWVAITFSRGSSPPRNRTRVSCIAGRATREALGHQGSHKAQSVCLQNLFGWPLLLGSRLLGSAGRALQEHTLLPVFPSSFLSLSLCALEIFPVLWAFAVIPDS